MPGAIARTLIILVATGAIRSYGALEVSVQGVTNTQAIVTYTAPNDNPCTISLREAGATAVVHDLNPDLFPGSNLDNRAGSIPNGRLRTVVFGKRAAEKAANGKYYSRALQAYTDHEYTVSCGSSSAVGQFTTDNIPIGLLYPELPGYAADGYGQYAWPSIDWSDQSKSYIDPLTGILIKRLTSPLDEAVRLNPQNFDVAVDPQGGWTNAVNAKSGSASQMASTSDTQPLFLGISRLTISYEDMKGYAALRTVDDFLENITATGAGTQAEREFEVCLTVDSGQTCASNSLTLTAGSGSAGPVPSPGGFGQAPFVRWGGKPLEQGLVAPPSGIVNVSGNLVTHANPGAGNQFSVNWAPGTKIYIQGSSPGCAQELCTITEVKSSVALTIAESLTLEGKEFRAANFGLRIAKKTAGGSLSLTATYDAWTSRTFTMPANGSNDLCSKASDLTYVAADGTPLDQPQRGYLCILTTGGDNTLRFFIPATGEMRLLSRFFRPYSGSNGDEFAGQVRVPVSSFDATDPRAFYGTAITGPQYSTALFKGRYEGDYRTWTGGMSGPLLGPDNVVWTNLTPASQNRDVGKQMADANPYVKDGYLKFLFGIGLLGDYFIFQMTNQQDGPCVIGFVDIRTGVLNRTMDTWSHPTGRWGVCHSIQALGAGNWIFSAINPARFPQPTDSLFGPYRMQVNQVFKNGAWQSNTTLLNNEFDTCPADLAQVWKDKGATGNNCIRVRVGGEPCSRTPTDLEKTKLPCPYNSAWSMLQPALEGDMVWDFLSRGITHTERMRIVRKTVIAPDNIELVLHRKAECFEGAAPTNWDHANGWTLEMAQTGGCYGAGWWADMTGASPGWVMEDPRLTGSHNDYGVSTDNTRFTAVKGAYEARSTTVPESLNTPFPVNINGFPTFAGSTAVTTAPIETYPSMRQWTAPFTERHWTLDIRAYQHGLGVNAETALVLFNHNVQLVSGTQRVYKVNNAAGGFDRKRVPYIAWAGRNWLKDISGLDSVIGDADLFTFCVADKAGECRPDSQVNEVFLNVPKATVASPATCLTNQYSSNNLCFTTASPIGAWIVQWDVRQSDTRGNRVRRLSMGFSGPGRQYTFSNARATPDAKWMFFLGYWLEGYRTEFMAAKLPPWPSSNRLVRGDDFVPVDVTRAQVNGASWLRVRFGYVENGNVKSFYCTARREACVAGGVPYSFESESPKGVACSNGCTVRVPAIAGRVLYYEVERLDDAGAVIGREPIQAVTVW